MVHTVINVSTMYLYLSLTLVIGVGAFSLHKKREIELLPARPPLSFLTFTLNMILILLCLNGTVAACDGRISSPAPAVGLHPEVPADTGVPQGAPVQIDEIPPEVPQLYRPLMGDAFRTRELHLRLGLYFMGRNTWRDNCVLLGILEKQVLVEKKIEAALVHDGYNPISVVIKRHEIRTILFNHPTRASVLSERTLDSFLDQIARNGTRQSIPGGGPPLLTWKRVGLEKRMRDGGT